MLSDSDIKALLAATKPGGKHQGERIERSDGSRRQGGTPGLRFRAAAGVGSWWLWYRTATGEARRLKLGDYHASDPKRGLSLSAARAKADELRVGIRSATKPTDPQEAKRTARAAAKAAKAAAAVKDTTFADACAAFVAEELPHLRPATRESWSRYVSKEIVPAFGTLKPEDITAEAIADIRARIANGVPGPKPGTWKRKPAPVSARRMFEVLRRILGWLSAADPDLDRLRRKHRLRRLEVNPAATVTAYRRKRRAGKRTRAEAAAKAFSDAQLRAVFEAAEAAVAKAKGARDAADRRGKRKHSGPTAHETEARSHANLLALVAHTAVRAHDARSARWADVDESRKLWTVPEHKTSDHTGAPHVVPLSDGALRVLTRQREANLAAGYGASEWLFPAVGEKPCEVCEATGHVDKDAKAARRIKAAAGIAGRGLLHRLRDTLRTRLSEHGTEARVAEAILAHVPPGIVGTYDHAELLPQRREALAWWSGELDKGPRGRVRAARN
jgi:integrase